MNTYLKNLNIEINKTQIDSICETVLNFHNTNKNLLEKNYDPGNMLNKPNLGYYISLFEPTHRKRNVNSWKSIQTKILKDFEIDIIKMKINDKTFQNIHVVNNVKDYFDFDFYEKIQKIIDFIPFSIQPESASILVQEFGYSMTFHKDSGVESRIHVVLNKNQYNYFYTDDKKHMLEYANFYLLKANKTTHGFMCFDIKPRIHLMVDIV